MLIFMGFDSDVWKYLFVEMDFSSNCSVTRPSIRIIPTWCLQWQKAAVISACRFLHVMRYGVVLKML